MGRFTDKQRAFIDNYVKTLNATEAARRAQYQGNDITLASVGYENLRKPHIRAEIDRKLEELEVTDSEVLHRLGQQALGDIGDALRIDHGVVMVDIEKLKEQGKTHLLKKFKHNKSGGIEVEFHDPQSALVHLFKLRRLLEEKPTAIIKLQQAIKEGALSPDQVKERWPSLADKLFSEAGINAGNR